LICKISFRIFVENFIMTDLELLKKVLSIPTYTFKEDKIVEFICEWLDNENIPYVVDEMYNVYATKTSEGYEGNLYPCMVRGCPPALAGAIGIGAGLCAALPAVPLDAHDMDCLFGGLCGLVRRLSDAVALRPGLVPQL